MSNHDVWKTRSDRDEYPENYDPNWKEDIELPGELYDEFIDPHPPEAVLDALKQGQANAFEWIENRARQMEFQRVGSSHEMYDYLDELGIEY